jgi:hypothetical protein
MDICFGAKGVGRKGTKFLVKWHWIVLLSGSWWYTVVFLRRVSLHWFLSTIPSRSNNCCYWENDRRYLHWKTTIRVLQIRTVGVGGKLKAWSFLSSVIGSCCFRAVSWHTVVLYFHVGSRCFLSTIPCR